MEWVKEGPKRLYTNQTGVGSDRAGFQLWAEGRARPRNRSAQSSSARVHGAGVPAVGIFACPVHPRSLCHLLLGTSPLLEVGDKRQPLSRGTHTNCGSTRPRPRTTWVWGWLLANLLLSSETLNHLVMAPPRPIPICSQERTWPT